MNYQLLFHKNSLMPRLTAVACFICVVIWIGLTMGGENMTWEQAAKWGYFPDSVIWEGKPWVLLTSVFVHFEIWHMAFNVYWLWILGNILEDTIGPWRWLLFFVGAAIFSSSLELFTAGSAGIGMSGVGYALFGFGWIARYKVPAFGQVLTKETIATFLIWMVGCAVATELGLANIANGAHLGGLAFGAAVAALFVLRWQPIISGAGFTALIALGFLPLFWCPLSPDWTGLQASSAHEKGDFPTAIYWYKRSLARGQDPSWVWNNLAIIYQYDDDQKLYDNALKELRKVDKKAADAMEHGSDLPE